MGVVTENRAPARPLTPIDPRIRQRRIEVRRQQGRRRLLVLGLLVGMAAIAAAVWGALQSPLADLDKFQIQGSTRTPVEAVVEATGLVRGTALVDIDLTAAEEGVARLPWVSSASVSRAWPNSVRVDVVERVPAAAVPEGDQWVMLDADGWVLARVPEPPAEVPVVELDGAPGDPGSRVEGAGAVLDVAQRIPDRLEPSIEVVRLGSDGITLLLVGDVEARLGPSEQLEAKLQSLATLLERVEMTGVTVLDIRLPYSPVVRRQ